MRSFVPALVLLVLVGLVILLPKRGDRGAEVPYLLPGTAAVGRDLAAALMALSAPELEEPPGWALSRGDDDVARWLDRLAWGGHLSLGETRQALSAHGGALADRVLPRLEALGSTDPIQTAKLVGVLSEIDGKNPAVVEAVSRLAYAESSLVTKAALRVLTHLEGDAALGPILDRRRDADLEIRAHARAALGMRARAGDQEALAYVVHDLDESPSDPDIAYLLVLGETEVGPEALDVLRRVVDSAGHEARMTALSALLAQGDADAADDVAAMIADSDPITRLNALRMAHLARVVVGMDSWTELARNGSYQEVTSLIALFDRAVRTGHDAALRAVELLESIAADPTNSAQGEAIAVLLGQNHPWAVERSRLELQQGVGAHLAGTVHRVVRVGGEPLRALWPVVHERLTSEEKLADSDQLLLMRVLVAAEPAQALALLAPRVREDSSFGLAVASLIAPTGARGLAILADGVTDDRGAALYVLVASEVRDPAALPVLSAIVLDRERDMTVRRHALDAMVRIRGGDRVETLRSTALALEDESLRQRARLLFWNHL